MNYDYTLQEMENNILNYLGGPTVQVELTSSQIQFAISESARTLSRYIPTIRRVTLPVFPGMAEYNLIDVDNRQIQTVFQTVRVNQNTIFYNIIKLDPLLHPYNVDDFIEIIQLIQMREKFMNMDPNFDFDPVLQILHFFPPISIGEIYAIVTYQVTPNLNELTQYNYRWVERYATAIQKELLGRVRSKYSGVNTPIGQVQMDGQTLLSEQSAEKTQLLQELMARVTADVLKYAHFVG